MKKRNVWPFLLLLFATSRAAARHGFTLAQLRLIAARAGFPDPDLAAAVAMAESGGNRFAVGDHASSFGLWQIHTPAHPQYRAAELFDADNNARAAFEISRGGTNWQPWTTFRNGDHVRFLPGGRTS